MEAGLLALKIKAYPIAYAIIFVKGLILLNYLVLLHRFHTA